MATKENKWIELVTKKCKEFVMRRGENGTETDIVFHITQTKDGLKMKEGEFEIIKIIADEHGYVLKSKSKERERKNEANRRYRERKKASEKKEVEPKKEKEEKPTVYKSEGGGGKVMFDEKDGGKQDKKLKEMIEDEFE